jgi:hypothetical protein
MLKKNKSRGGGGERESENLKGNKMIITSFIPST